MIEKMTSRYKQLLKDTNIDGVDMLINHLEENGFFEAPASTQYHMSRPAGLLEHSLNVYDVMRSGYTAYQELKYSVVDLTIASLLHDIGKMGWDGEPQYVENRLKSGALSEAKPYATNTDLIKMQHQDLSLLTAMKFIRLTNDQIVAIKYHNGLYTPDGRDISGKEVPLMVSLHYADMWASRFMEA